MERRIRKIVKLAAYKKNNVLVLGAFGCGVFNNNPKEVARIFAKVLVNEGLKDYFKLVVFPIYKDDKCKKFCINNQFFIIKKYDKKKKKFINLNL